MADLPLFPVTVVGSWPDTSQTGLWLWDVCRSPRGNDDYRLPKALCPFSGCRPPAPKTRVSPTTTDLGLDCGVSRDTVL